MRLLPTLGVLWRTPPVLAAGLFWTIGAVALTALPATGTPGYLHALAVNLGVGLVGLPAGIAAVRAARRGGTTVGRSPLGAAVAVWASATALLVAAVVLALFVALVGALRVGTCDLGHDLLWYLLLPLPSAGLAAAGGVAIGTAFPRRRHGALATVVVLIGALAASLVPVLTGPQAFVFNGLLGWVPGPLYDEHIVVNGPLLWHRLLVLSGIAALLGAVGLLLRPADVRLVLPARPRRRGALALLVVGAAGVLGLQAGGERLGFRQSDASVARALGGVVRTGHFVIHYPRERGEAWGRRLAADHEFRHAQLTAWLGLPADGPVVRSFVFRDAAEKRRLTGAGRTSIAKPWLRALYLDDRGLPHPILKHELAHVLAADWGRGPFAVATSNGILPHDALLEGLAVAADWRPGALTVHEWARAMRELGVAPDVRRLFGGSGFRTESASRAYTVSGSFLRWLADTRGVDALRRAYEAGDLAAVAPPEALFAEWEAFLGGLALAPEAVRLAEARFRRPSVVHRPCAVDVARARAAADAARARGDLSAAAGWLARCRALEPGEPAHPAAEMDLRWQAQDAPATRAAALAVRAHPAADATLRARAARVLGDLAWEAGRPDEARIRWAEVLDGGAGPDLARAAAARLLALEDPAAPRLRPLLLGRLSREAALSDLHAAWAETPGSPLVAYLLGRQLYNAGLWERALPWLERARQAGLPEDGGLAFENLRLQARARYEAGDLAGAADAWRAVAVAAPGEGARIEAADWLARVAFEAVRRP